MEHLPRKETNLQNKSLEGQYIKQWHQNIFDKETKVKENKQRLKYFLDAGRFFFFPLIFSPSRLQNNNKKKGKINQKKKKIKLFTVHIFTLRHFCWGERRLI